MIEERELVQKVEQVYESTRLFFLRNKNKAWAVPSSTSPNVGFSVLYTPIIDSPKILLVGQNPGNFGDKWDDEKNLQMLSGKIPKINTYLEFAYPLGQILRKVFGECGCMETLKGDLVGMNVWHCQAKGTPKLDSVTRSHFEKNTMEIVNLLKPKNIVCVGVQAFDAINQLLPAKNVQVHNYGGRYYGEGEVSFADGDNVPVYLVGHLTGSRTPADQTQKALVSAITKIHSKDVTGC